jgi:hypothetical protein
MSRFTYEPVFLIKDEEMETGQMEDLPFLAYVAPPGDNARFGETDAAVPGEHNPTGLDDDIDEDWDLYLPPTDSKKVRQVPER